MKARIPAGIDLDDKLLYGLSPARLGYVTALVVAAIWVLRQPLPTALRFGLAALLLATAALAGWMRRSGRHLDAWAADLARHVRRRYRVRLDLGTAAASRHRPFAMRLPNRTMGPHSLRLRLPLPRGPRT